MENFKLFAKEKTNRRLLWIAIGGSILQFVVFKCIYPFPDFISDSYSYIYAAQNNLSVNILPIGYSKFLLLFHVLTHSDLVLIAFQYFLLAAAASFFFFSILFFYRPGKGTRNASFFFLCFNPLLSYLSNYVSAEPLFTALSLIWFTQLLWLIHRPFVSQIILQAVLLFLCVTINDHAYYYFLISIIAFLLSVSKPLFKLLGIIAPLMLILPFVLHTRMETRRETGVGQLSLTRGWELANNALFLRRYVAVDSSRLPSKESREVDRMVTKFIKRAGPERLSSYLSGYIDNFFIQDPVSPLKTYFYAHGIPNDKDGIASWGKTSAVFGEYGSWLIRSYPLSFARHYLIPNMASYLHPPIESLESYNQGEEEIELSAQEWFNYRTPIVSTLSATAQGKILLPAPYLFSMAQVLFAGGLLWWLFKTRGSTKSPFTRPLLLSGSFWLINFVASVFNRPIFLRQQVFPLLISMIFALLLLEFIEKKDIRLNRAVNLSPSSPPLLNQTL
jgi:hypothetical protein